MPCQQHRHVQFQQLTIALKDAREQQAFDLPGQILQGDKAHHRALLGGLGAQRGQDAAHDHLSAVLIDARVGALLELRHPGGVDFQRFQLLAVLVQRMAGHIHARHLFFHGQ